MQLKSQPRTILGKKVKTIRKEGLIPAELYGHGIPNEHVTVNVKDFLKTFDEAGHTSVVNLFVGKKEVPVIIAETQKNPLTNEILNVCFRQVKMDELIEARVPITFIGEAPATKKGFIVIKALNEIEIEALPQYIPSQFEVNIENLEEPDQRIAVKDLKMEKGVELLTSPDTIIVIVGEKEDEEEASQKQESETATTSTTEETTESSDIKEKETAQK